MMLSRNVNYHRLYKNAESSIKWGSLKRPAAHKILVDIVFVFFSTTSRVLVY